MHIIHSFFSKNSSFCNRNIHKEYEDKHELHYLHEVHTWKEVMDKIYEICPPLVPSTSHPTTTPQDKHSIIAIQCSTKYNQCKFSTFYKIKQQIIAACASERRKSHQVQLVCLPECFTYIGNVHLQCSCFKQNKHDDMNIINRSSHDEDDNKNNSTRDTSVCTCNQYLETLHWTQCWDTKTFQEGTPVTDVTTSKGNEEGGVYAIYPDSALEKVSEEYLERFSQTETLSGGNTTAAIDDSLCSNVATDHGMANINSSHVDMRNGYSILPLYQKMAKELKIWISLGGLLTRVNAQQAKREVSSKDTQIYHYQDISQIGEAPALDADTRARVANMHVVINPNGVIYKSNCYQKVKINM